METYQYEEVNTEPDGCDLVGCKDDDIESDKPSWTPFLRQMYTCSGIWVMYFNGGLATGAPTVIIPQMRREANSTDVITDEVGSWFSSLIFYSGIPWVIILSMSASLFGRKWSFMFANVSSLIGFIGYYFSSTATHLIISQLFHGVNFGSLITVCLIMLTECTSAKYRGVFVSIKTGMIMWGIWISNAVGTFCYWKMIAIVGIICNVYSILNCIFWKESPNWLASLERFDECAASHRWYKGNARESKNELKCLIISSTKHIETNSKSMSSGNRANIFITTITSKAYYKSIGLAVACMFVFGLSGKYYCALYAIDIIKSITNDESTAYTGMLILDGVTVASIYVGAILTKYISRRTLLLSFASTEIFFLVIISLYFYLVNKIVINENKYVSIALLTGYSMAIGCGPLMMTSCIFAELIPIRYKSFTVFIYGAVHYSMLATTIKLGPLTVRLFQMHGVFLIYAVSSSLFLFILYIYLPELKDRTPQEIEDLIVKNKARIRL